ncbi:hypothetical protein ACIBF6_13230 [Streptosporangium amethystogenes]|uniref:hypothetical protein n=1 Tax=Streptosporangium amethystogenes TaxID=2002 RepID=UPI0037938B72
MGLIWIAVSLSLLVSVTVVVAALSRPALRSRLPALTCVGAAGSLAHVIGAVRPEPGAAALGMIESLALMTLAGLITRYAPARRAWPTTRKASEAPSA